MKSFEKFFYHTCAYTTLISALFYLVAKMMAFSEIALGFGRFFLILAFGAIISASELIFNISKIKRSLRYLIHFSSLFVVFLIAFIIIKKQSGASFTFTSFLTALLVYAAIYAVILAVIKLFNFISSKIQKKVAPKKESTYRPRFNKE